MRVLASNGTLQARGSLFAQPTEQTVTAAGAPPTITLSLLDDSWVDSLGTASSSANSSLAADGNEAAFALLAGIRSQQDSPLGFNRVIQPALLPTHIQRVDNATLTITLPEARRYASFG